jgi:hypothetical protein
MLEDLTSRWMTGGLASLGIEYETEEPRPLGRTQDRVGLVVKCVVMERHVAMDESVL